MVPVQTPYDITLDIIYNQYFLNSEYIKFINEQKRYFSTSLFNESLRTYTINFGRQTGATTSIVKFIEKYPELNFGIVTRNNNTFKEIGNKFLNKSKNYKYIKNDTDINPSIDIIFVDPYSYMYRDISFILNNINTHLNSNQILILIG